MILNIFKIIQCQNDLELKEFNKISNLYEKAKVCLNQDQEQAFQNKDSSSQQHKNYNGAYQQLNYMNIQGDEQIINELNEVMIRLDNLDKPQVFQMINLIENPYIQQQFNNYNPNIDPQVQPIWQIPNLKVPKSSEVDAGKQNSFPKLQNQSIQSPQNKQLKSQDHQFPQVAHQNKQKINQNKQKLQDDFN